MCATHAAGGFLQDYKQNYTTCKAKLVYPNVTGIPANSTGGCWT